MSLSLASRIFTTYVVDNQQHLALVASSLYQFAQGKQEEYKALIRAMSPRPSDDCRTIRCIGKITLSLSMRVQAVSERADCESPLDRGKMTSRGRLAERKKGYPVREGIRLLGRTIGTDFHIGQCCHGDWRGKRPFNCHVQKFARRESLGPSPASPDFSRAVV